jgi:hypothetical protein
VFAIAGGNDAQSVLMREMILLQQPTAEIQIFGQTPGN